MKSLFYHPKDKNLVASWRLAYVLDEEQVKLLPATIKKYGANVASIKIRYGHDGAPKASVKQVFAGWRPIVTVVKQSSYPLNDASVESMKNFLDNYNDFSHSAELVVAKSTCRLTKIPKLSPSPLLRTNEVYLPSPPKNDVAAFNVSVGKWFDGKSYTSDNIFCTNDLAELKARMSQAYYDNTMDDPDQAPWVYVRLKGSEVECIGATAHPQATKSMLMMKENSLRAIIPAAKAGNQRPKL